MEGEVNSDKKSGHAVDKQVVTPGYFSALGTSLLPLLRSRFFSPVGLQGDHWRCSRTGVLGSQGRYPLPRTVVLQVTENGWA